MKKIFILLFFILALGVAASAQIQSIETTDSLAVRRAKENANFNYLFNQIQGQSHANINFLNLLPGALGASGNFLKSNGTGVVFTNDGSTLTNIPAAAITGTIAVSHLPVMGASGTGHSAGLVPDPGATPGTTRFLREDGTWQNLGAGSGTVTSVAVSLPGEFNVTGSPITINGTITATWMSKAANLVFTSPDGSTGTPGFRQLVANDLPALQSLNGLLSVDKGGTGLNAVGAANTVLKSNGTANSYGQIVNADVSASAAVAWSKISKSGSILDDLGDVAITSPVNGHVLTYQGGVWLNQAPSGTGLATLNSQTGATQTLAVGTSGTDFAINSSGDTHTFNLPSASGTARGVVTTGNQTFAGNKTFSGNAAVNGSLTIGSGTAIVKVLSSYSTLDFDTVNPHSAGTIDVTFTGAASGDLVMVTPPSAVVTGSAIFEFNAIIPAADTVRIRFINNTDAFIDLASGSYRIVVIKF